MVTVVAGFAKRQIFIAYHLAVVVVFNIQASDVPAHK